MKATTLIVNGKIAIAKCFLATGFFSRFMGLMGRRSLPGDQAVFFPKCNSIHTFFMRFPIDVILVGEQGKVVEVVSHMKPWRMMMPRRGVKHVIEMAPGRSGEIGIQPSSVVQFDGVTI